MKKRKEKNKENINLKMFIQSLIFSIFFLVLLILKSELVITLIFFLLSLLCVIIFGFRLYKNKC